MSVLAISKETKDKTRSKAGIDEERTKEAVKILKEWLVTQPHLPHDYGKYCNNSLILFGWISVDLKSRRGDTVTLRALRIKKGQLCRGGTLHSSNHKHTHTQRTHKTFRHILEITKSDY
jgi:hypothetical protein